MVFVNPGTTSKIYESLGDYSLNLGIHIEYKIRSHEK